MHTKVCEQIFRNTQDHQSQAGSGGPTKITPQVMAIVEQQMQRDDETTAYQLHQHLQSILRCQASHGWTFRGSTYCQLIRAVNKQMHLEWAQQNVNDTLDNVIWTDECSVQLESHRRFCCRKIGEAPRPKPR